MTDSHLFVVSVDKPPPAEVAPSVLGVGLVGAPDNLFLVVHEELLPEEVDAVRRGDFLVAVKIYRREGLAGLAWRFLFTRSDLIGFANYSLEHVRERLGQDVFERYVESTRGASLAGSPGFGLLLSVVFVSPETGLVFGLRAFTLPRLFSDRFLAAILATVDQDLQTSADAIERAFALGPAVWPASLPGIAVAGEEIELDEGDLARLVRKQRARRRDRR